MTGEIVELYSDGEMSGMKKKIRVWTVALCLLGAAALGACIAMAAMTGTGNAERMELYAVATATVSGWIVLYCAYFVVGTCRRELLHAAMLRAEERTRVEGIVTVTKAKLAIRKSITARRVEVRSPEGLTRMLVTENRAAKLMNAGAVAVYSAHGYVAAYEVRS